VSKSVALGRSLTKQRIEWALSMYIERQIC